MKHYGESGRASEEYFVWDQQLEFVFRRDEQYTRPMSGVVREAREQRFYFVDGQLVRWLGVGNVPQAVDRPAARQQAAQLLEQARQFASCAIAATQICAA